MHSITIKHKEAVTLWPKLSTDWFDDAVDSETEWPKFRDHIVDGAVLKCRLHVGVQEFGGRVILSLFPIKTLSSDEVAKL